MTLAVCFKLFMISRFLIHHAKCNKSEKLITKDKFFIDYYIYATWIMIEPSTISNLRIFRSLTQNTKSGLIMTIILLWGGFFLSTVYQQELLTGLMVPTFEKEIETVTGKGNLEIKFKTNI